MHKSFNDQTKLSNDLFENKAQAEGCLHMYMYLLC